MSPDKLQQIIWRMTPGIWYADVTPSGPSGQMCRSEEVQVINGPSIASMPHAYDATDYRFEAHRWQRNAVGIAAIYNHASALVECALVLKEIKDSSDHDDDVYFRLGNRINAAIKRLEEIQ